MKFSEIVKQASDLLRDAERISYRALKREFDLDEEALEDLKYELIKARRVARDEDGEILVWAGNGRVPSTQTSPPHQSQSPASYTPPHLAERILAEQEERAERIVQIRQGLATLRTLGIELWRPTHLAWLTEAYQKAGQAEEGLSTLDEALEVVGQTEECWYEAELYRLKGELLLRQGNQKLKGKEQKAKIEELEECFQKAINIARRQQAKSWELRAATSLARLWQQQGKKAKARQLLSDIYNWFTEGFDTKDLQEAKALLEELS